jgi:tetratricopeptide (TPR) repeat protein
MKVYLRNVALLVALLPSIGFSSLFHHDPADDWKAGVAKQAEGDWTAAITDFDKAIEQQPDFADAYVSRGESKYKRGDFHGALADYDHAIQLNPTLAPVNHVARSGQTSLTNEVSKQALVFLTIKDYANLDELAATLRASKEQYPDGVWKLDMVYDGLVPPSAAADADWNARITAIQEWSASDPDSVTAKVALANIMTCFAWKARGTGTEVSEANGKLFVTRIAGSVDALKAAQKCQDRCPVLWRVMLRDALAMGVNKEIFHGLCEQSLQSEPDYMSYYFGRAIYFLPQWYGTKGEWASDLSIGADTHGITDGDQLYAQVVWNMHQRYDSDLFVSDNLDWSRVSRGFDLIEKSFPNALDARIERARLAIMAHDGPFVAAYQSGAEKAAKGDLKGAMVDYTTASQQPSKIDFLAFHHRGLAEFKLANVTGALADFTKAIELNPSYAPAYCSRASLEQTKLDYDAALTDENKAIELDARFALAYFGRGNVEEARGQYDAALADYIKTVEIQPDYTDALTARDKVRTYLNHKFRATAELDKSHALSSVGN